jgi:hypothetical protein
MRFLLRTFTAALGLAATPVAADTPLFDVLEPRRAELTALRWEVRPVLIFAPDDNDPNYQEQIRLLKDAEEELRERDILVLSDTDPDANGRLRSGLAVEGFEVFLVGKDGGVKLRESQPLTVETLIAKIDAMPMRRREMLTD